MDGVLLVEDDGPVRVLTLNRPEARNALSLELARALRRAAEAVDRDPVIHAMVLTGSDPAFCAGFDLKEGGRDRGAYFERMRNENPIDALAGIATPVLGAINGAAYTGGLELALACSFLIASDRATFADTHASVGFVPRMGLTVRLPQFVGPAHAVRMSMTSEVVDATHAERIGLVTEVVSHAELGARALELAHKIGEAQSAAILATSRMYAAGAAARLGSARMAAEEIGRSYEPDYAGLEERRRALLARNRSDRE